MNDSGRGSGMIAGSLSGNSLQLSADRILKKMGLNDSGASEILNCSTSSLSSSPDRDGKQFKKSEIARCDSDDEFESCEEVSGVKTTKKVLLDMYDSDDEFESYEEVSGVKTTKKVSLDMYGKSMVQCLPRSSRSERKSMCVEFGCNDGLRERVRRSKSERSKDISK